MAAGPRLRQVVGAQHAQRGGHVLCCAGLGQQPSQWALRRGVCGQIVRDMKARRRCYSEGEACEGDEDKAHCGGPSLSTAAPARALLGAHTLARDIQPSPSSRVDLTPSGSGAAGPPSARCDRDGTRRDGAYPHTAPTHTPPSHSAPAGSRASGPTLCAVGELRPACGGCKRGSSSHPIPSQNQPTYPAPAPGATGPAAPPPPLRTACLPPPPAAGPPRRRLRGVRGHYIT